MRQGDWKAFKEHVPPARDCDPSAPLPDRAAQAASASPEEAARGIAALEATLGREWRESSADLLPGLVDLASGGAAHHRHRVVRLLARLADLNGTSPAWPALEPRLAALLADEDPRVRGHATRLAPSAVRDRGPALRARWDVETDRGVRPDHRQVGRSGAAGGAARVGRARARPRSAGRGRRGTCPADRSPADGRGAVPARTAPPTAAS
ncbi:hypothetical protein [Actinosynnema mirum]|uniref:Uncharacterized protein n=1 Tax=Actinosynnema mirum (strain ATCC 29888 / DSM 43827 / JCM 3225 / NBRC 14064 / NCIMB 13271 / NRRL B-12336 / IMRU 3971 / 101) TaxID=446462 RepID=C6WFR4_ACTMD|nr:hypothetical protein [Actinosynnema mirum]ACU37850.1 hypothetical protein Amir_3985 [Actinosynnema mirum DSM 43827]